MKMLKNKIFVTFGQDHTHTIDGKLFDKDCVAVIDGDRNTVWELFGPKFCCTYSEGFWREEKIALYPRGYIYV